MVLLLLAVLLQLLLLLVSGRQEGDRVMEGHTGVGLPEA